MVLALALVVQATAVAGAHATAASSTICPAHTIVVANANGLEQSQGVAQPYYTFERCNDPANGGKGYTTEAADPAKQAGVVTLVDVASCQLDCLGRDTFDFPGARTVTHLRMGHNPFASLPEELLWNMTSLVDISLEVSGNLETLPPAFFKGQGLLAKLVMSNSARLGAKQLPEQLFRGLWSLVELNLGDCPSVASLPNLDDLTALTDLTAYADGNGGGSIQLNEADSATKFNRLAALDVLLMVGQSLVSVPNLYGLASLTALYLKSNAITSIAQGAFAGAPQLVMLLLGNNLITHVAPGAFNSLASLRVLAADFAPMLPDGQPWHSPLVGAGMWLHSGTGYFGPPEEFAFRPISFSPNPTRCEWVGPNVSSFDCSSCMLGFETAGPDNATCVMPVFRPYRAWAANYSRLRLQGPGALGNDEKGHMFGSGAITEPSASNVPRLLTGHTYTMPAPLLEPKQQTFVGCVNCLPSQPMQSAKSQPRNFSFCVLCRCCAPWPSLHNYEYHANHLWNKPFTA